MTDLHDLVIRELSQARDVLSRFIGESNQTRAIIDAADIIYKAFMAGNKVICCGNGGSMCDAMHMAEELTGKFREDRRPIPAVAISDPSYLSCAANDFGYDQVFSRYVDGLGVSGDVLLAISTSGESQNVLNALASARKKNIASIVLTGNDGGAAGQLSDIEIRVPHTGYSDRIQEIHIKIIHILITLIEEKLSG